MLISTGTRTLQDQLFSRDLPRVRGAGRAGDGRAAQGARQLYLPLSPGPHAGRRARPEIAFRDRAAAPDPGVRRHLQDRRPGRSGADTRRRRDLAARDLHARELPGPGMSAHPRLFRGQGAAPGAGRRRGGGQPRALHGRPGAARRGRDRPAARGRHGDLRRSPPAARHGHAFPGQQRVHAPAAGFRPRAGSGGPTRAKPRAGATSAATWKPPRASCGWSVRRWTSCRAARRPSRRCPRPRNSTRRWRCCARPWTRPPTRWARSPKSIPT